MRNFIYLLLLIGLVNSYGCKTMRLTEIEQKEQERQLTRDLGYQFVESFATNKKDKFIDLLSVDIQENFNSLQFEHSYKNILEQYGEIENFTFVCFLENPVYNIQIWKLTFIKNDIVNDILFRILSLKDNEFEQEQISGFAFI